MAINQPERIKKYCRKKKMLANDRRKEKLPTRDKSNEVVLDYYLKLV
jgi:hypothetical protein